MNCPSCNQTVRDVERFCRYCGASLAEAKQAAPASVEKPLALPVPVVIAPVEEIQEPQAEAIQEPQGSVCPSCGAILREGAKFCNGCGLNISCDMAVASQELPVRPAHNDAPQAELPPPVEPSEQPNKKIAAIVIASIAGLIIVIATIAGGLQVGFTVFVLLAIIAGIVALFVLSSKRRIKSTKYIEKRAIHQAKEENKLQQALRGATLAPDRSIHIQGETYYVGTYKHSSDTGGQTVPALLTAAQLTMGKVGKVCTVGIALGFIGTIAGQLADSMALFIVSGVVLMAFLLAKIFVFRKAPAYYGENAQRILDTLGVKNENQI